MRITGYRTLTTVHDWGRPVGDANGVFHDGRRDGAADPGRHRRGHHRRRAGIAPGARAASSPPSRERTHGPPSPSTTGCSATCSRPATPAPSSARSAPWTRRCGTSRRRPPASRCGGCSAGCDRTVPAYASGLDIALSEEELAAVYRTYAERGAAGGEAQGRAGRRPGPGQADPRPRRPRRRQPGRRGRA